VCVRVCVGGCVSGCVGGCVRVHMSEVLCAQVLARFEL